MNSTMIPTEQHVHLDLDLDVQHKFQYPSRGRDGHRAVLHQGDTITFTCGDEFSIRFVRSSPFEESMPHDRKLLIAAHVRHDAPVGVYEYVLEVMKDGQLFTDPKEGDILFPQIVVETGA